MPETALVVVDMLNTYDHEDADKLAVSVEEVLPNIVSLRDRAQERDDALLVYVNDNHDDWTVGRATLID